MTKPRRKLQMCVVNPVFVDGLSQLVGSQMVVMRRLGISWNTWTKIRSGRPVTLSVGQRLRSRIVNNQSAHQILKRDDSTAGEDYVEVLENIFLLPETGHEHQGHANERKNS